MIIRSQILGQNSLLDSLEKYTPDTFPHSIMLLGEGGSGKHLISSYIADAILNLPLMDISENLSPETLENIYIKGAPGVYLINIDEISEKDQNSVLKFIEEPLAHIFILVLCSSKNLALSTIVNRCVILSLERYHADTLKRFLAEDTLIANDVLENIVKTPGKAKLLDAAKLADISALCDKILNKLNLANYGNALSIAQKINYKDDYDKYDFQVFLNNLIYAAYLQMVGNENPKAFNFYSIICDSYKELQDNRLNKEVFVERLISKLWRAAK